MMNSITFTGGGSSGHVTPNIALIKKLKLEGWHISYIGSYAGIEKQLMEKEGIPYSGISSGKLRRQFNWQNFIDPFKILWGIMQSFFILRKTKPRVVFSKGGFVSFPVVLGAYLNGIPVIVHESDFTPGLANKISFPFAKNICVTFQETGKYIPAKNKIVVTGTPIRDELFHGDAEKGRAFCGLDTAKKMIFVFGGGLGSGVVNEALRKALPELLKKYYIVHGCGAGKIDNALLNLSGYKQFEYLHQELFDVMAAADMVVSRSGANSLYELLALAKPHLLIPLSKRASRGDQIDNAAYTQKQGLSEVIQEEKLTPELLCERIEYLDKNVEIFREKLQNFACKDGTDKVLEIIKQNVNFASGTM